MDRRLMESTEKKGPSVVSTTGSQKVPGLFPKDMSKEERKEKIESVGCLLQVVRRLLRDVGRLLQVIGCLLRDVGRILQVVGRILCDVGRFPPDDGGEVLRPV
jgi:hypothetical protein